MKKYLLVLLLLAMAVPAGAEVLVYTMSNKEVSFMEGSPDWEMEKENIKGYLILEGSEDDPTVNFWVIGLGKGKNPSTGKTEKYVGVEDIGELDIVVADVGKKILWIITSGDNENERILLIGEQKPTKIGGVTWNIAKKLTGNVIWDQEENPGERDLGSSKISLSLHTKYTDYAKGNDGEWAADALIEYLVTTQKYIETTPE